MSARLWVRKKLLRSSAVFLTRGTGDSCARQRRSAAIPVASPQPLRTAGLTVVVWPKAPVGGRPRTALAITPVHEVAFSDAVSVGIDHERLIVVTSVDARCGGVGIPGRTWSAPHTLRPSCRCQGVVTALIRGVTSQPHTPSVRGSRTVSELVLVRMPFSRGRPAEAVSKRRRPGASAAHASTGPE